MKQALSLMEVAELTWPKVPGKGQKTFADYCRFLYDQKEDIWIITRDGSLAGMIAARTAMKDLYVTMFVTLMPGCFEEFISRAKEHFGEIETVSYRRRGVLKSVKLANLQRIAL